MPKKITFDKFILEIDISGEKLIKTSICDEENSTTIFEGGLGVIYNLIYTNGILVANADLGWFFSKDIGVSWKNEDAWELENPEFFMEKNYEYFFMKSVLKRLTQNHPHVTNSNNLLLSNWLQKKVPGQMDIIEVSNPIEHNLLKSSIYETLVDYKLRKFLYLMGNETEENIAESIYQLHKEKGLLRNRSLLDNAIDESMFMKYPEINNLFNLEETFRYFKIMFDIKTVFIGDIYHLFQKDKSSDFIESTLNLLCESCYFLDIRIIVVLNLDRLDELQGAILPKTFSDPSCKRYTIDFQEQSNKITIRPKDEF